MRLRVISDMLALALLVPLLLSCGPSVARRLSGSGRGAEVNGWIPVRLQGSPRQIGFQHGYTLAPEIADALKVVQLTLTHDTKRDWAFLRKAAEAVLWPRVEEEYREELRGISEGLAAKGVQADVTDVVVLNAFPELSYYTDWLDASKASTAPERCSAFVATGSWTRGGQPVIAHNNWSGYLEGSRWKIIFDIRPEKGYRILMDGFPGMIHSGDDFGMNSAGLAITETTISQFKGFEPNGIPEFVRARKAMQYAATIDDFVRIMTYRNNGGYANAWLVADTKRNEIARLELGLKNVTLERTSDGYYVGANFPVSPKLAAEETTFRVGDPNEGRNVRHTRWEQLMAETKGRIDVAVARQFMADHYDAYEKKANAPSERTLCGHVDLSPRGSKPWQEPYGPAGTVQAKVADAAMVQGMEMWAAMGHPCGLDFAAGEFLQRHPEYGWQRALLTDLPSRPWTRFSTRQPY
ncbi:MAG TPA: C45 family peptidase [Thermoanaerobaculaceae bacterium]|nr:C45 family peptidase [Thermoanaerobaculaceae bacterium]